LCRLAAPEEDVIEIDELCIRQTPSLWLWTAVSRKLRQVLGFAIGPRDYDTLALCWSDVPKDWRDKPVITDGLTTYQAFFPAEQHRVVDKGSGETSIAESINTKWRQRQSGLVRHCCGASRRITDDLLERAFLLVEQHNSIDAPRKLAKQQDATRSGQ
jgi:IS1 family transposase